MSAKLKIPLIITAVLIITIFISFFTTIAVTGMTDRIFAGVYVRGMYLGGMTKGQADKALRAQADRLRDQIVEVRANGTKASLRLTDIDLEVDTDALLHSAWALGRRGNFLKQWQERRKTAREGHDLPYAFSFSEGRLQTVLHDIAKEIVIPPQDAKIVITPANTVEIAESVKGLEIDFNDALKQLQKVIADGDEPKITLALIPIEPSVTTEKIREMNINGLLASFTTYFDVTKTNRVYNIKVAAMALDGLIIQPGEEFSFNEVVGPRSQEAGYKLAPAILNNEFIDSLGGGVCQVSSTLYNVVLRSGVQVKQRSNHSLAVSYVPLGQDAAVAYGGKDLVFVNNLPSSLVIKASVNGNAVNIKFFGDTSLRKTVKVDNTIIKEYPFKVVYQDDPTLPVGEQIVKRHGIKGFRVVSSLKVFDGRTLISEQELLPSFYQAADQVVLVGTKPVPESVDSGSPDPESTAGQPTIENPVSEPVTDITP